MRGCALAKDVREITIRGQNDQVDCHPNCGILNLMRKVNDLRQEIAAVDRALVALLSVRGMLAYDLAYLKIEAGVPMRDAVQADAVVRRAVEMSHGPLDVAEIFRTITEQTLRLMEQQENNKLAVGKGE